MQLFFAGGISNIRIIELLTQQMEAHQERLAHYHAILLPTLAELGLQRLTLELGPSSEKIILSGWNKPPTLCVNSRSNQCA
ncbi:MAG: hypothetical protein K8L97_30865 [Anaerolineae bacterium]|nr:hypothetical protein [Anaerolineae bacterium]